MVAVLIYKMLQQVYSLNTKSAQEILTMINKIVVQHCVHLGPEFAGCPDEDGELYEDCTLTE